MLLQEKIFDLVEQVLEPNNEEEVRKLTNNLTLMKLAHDILNDIIRSDE